VGNSGPDFQSWSAADYRLRQTLQASERQIVNLDEEISFIQDYLEIEKARFGKRLCVEQIVSVDSAEIPCLTLQLLIENAIKHGAASKIGTTTIPILALQERDRGQIRVSGDGVGMPKEKGYGLRNLMARLNTLYATEFSWQIPKRNCSVSPGSFPPSVRTE